jgi:hypothetical protein
MAAFCPPLFSILENDTRIIAWLCPVPLFSKYAYERTMFGIFPPTQKSLYHAHEICGEKRTKENWMMRFTK